jgi:hypothetical protein
MKNNLVQEKSLPDVGAQAGCRVVFTPFLQSAVKDRSRPFFDPAS